MNSNTERPHITLNGANFDNRFYQLGADFYEEVLPTPVKAPALIAVNEALATELGLDYRQLVSPDGLGVLAGNTLAEGSKPLAAAYSGHQFGYFNPQLGDGRAILLGELRDAAGHTRDLQLKGSGPTPWSRGGDGRAAIGPVVREYLLSEAMHALGVKTTRALAAVTTGEPVFRDAPLPGAILTRVATSHIRVGTFEYWRARGSRPNLQKLFDFCVAKHFPALAQTAEAQRDFLRCVLVAQAELVANWMSFGFIHGVMNTDNTAISGETIDYGPCAFMEAYDPETVFSSIDRNGRYAYNQQPNIALWNLTRLAECLLLLMPQSETSANALTAVLEEFSTIFNDCWLRKMGLKLGFSDGEQNGAAQLEGFLQLMQLCETDFTLGFRSLCDAYDGKVEAQFNSLFKAAPERRDQWLRDWQQALADSGRTHAQVLSTLHANNPLYIPRNHKVAEVIGHAERGNLAPFHEMKAVLDSPFSQQPGMDDYASPAPAGEAVLQTFCGT